MQEHKWPLVTVIIVNYNGYPYLNEALFSLVKSSYKNIEIIVVDNCSTDNSLEAVKKQFGKMKNIRIIKLNRNYGFAKANNIGVKYAKGDYILFLNNDAEIQKDTIFYLIKAINLSPNIAFAQPKIVQKNNSKVLNSAGLDIHYSGIGLLRGLNCGVTVKRYNKYEYIMGVHGACFLAKKGIYIKLGGFDPKFFMYNEDTDLSWRCALHKYKIIYVPKALVYHYYSGAFKNKKLSTFKKLFYVNRNRLIMVLTNYSLLSLLRLTPLLAIIEFGFLLYALTIKQATLFLSVYATILREFKYIKNRRKIIRKSKKLENDLELLKRFRTEITIKELPRIATRALNNISKLYFRIFVN